MYVICWISHALSPSFVYLLTFSICTTQCYGPHPRLSDASHQGLSNASHQGLSNASHQGLSDASHQGLSNASHQGLSDLILHASWRPTCSLNGRGVWVHYWLIGLWLSLSYATRTELRHTSLGSRLGLCGFSRYTVHIGQIMYLSVCECVCVSVCLHASVCGCVYLTFTHSCTRSHTDGGVNQAVRVRCLAQGHLNTQLGGAGDWTTRYQPTHSTSWATATHMCG